VTTDLWTVLWKEWRELLTQGGSRRWNRLGLFLSIGIPGVFIPARVGREWLDSGLVLFLTAWFPLFAVIAVVADAFAGERERHTLDTLLATPLSDRAILFGKVTASLFYGWGLGLAMLVLGWVTVNVVEWSGFDGLLFYRSSIGLGAVAIGALSSGLAATTGVLVSLRAATVRQAQRTLTTGVMLLGLIPTIGAPLLPAGLRNRLTDALRDADLARLILIAVVLLAAVDVGFLLAGMARFQRSRLVLD
jgi:ABC-2 type transport system permease protein